MINTKGQVALSEMNAGEKAIIRSFRVGRIESYRLASLGFTPGVQVFITHNYGRGPIIVLVRGTRVALGRREASRIIVERLSND